MKFGPAVIPTVMLTLALGSCSDPDFTQICLDEVSKKIPKEANIDVTKNRIAKQGMSATIFLAITSAIKKKNGDDELTYYTASCIFKSDKLAKSFLRPRSG